MRDMVIIGGGIAGITAAIYAERYGLDYVMITKNVGGLLGEITHVWNYPCFSGTGPDMIKDLKETIAKAEIIKDDVLKIEPGFNIVLENNVKIKTKTVVIATGTHKKHLKLDESRYIGKGVSYCATCDAPMFTGKEILVYGGGNAAAYSAMLLATYAKKITIIYRGDKFKMDAKVKKKLKDKNVKLMKNTKIKELIGDKFLEGVILDSGKKIKAQGLFVNIGSVPTTEILNDLKIKHNRQGFIKTNELMETSYPGIYAAGDVRDKKLRQLITAASDGAIAAYSAYMFVSK